MTKQDEYIKIIADSIDTQKQDLNKMVEAINWLTSAVTSVVVVVLTSTNISNEETLLENQNGSNVHLRTQSQVGDEVSLNASNLWFGNNANDPQDHQRVNNDIKNTNPEENQPALLNENGSKAWLNMNRTLAMDLKYPCV